jgi:hypothetical protein
MELHQDTKLARFYKCLMFKIFFLFGGTILGNELILKFCVRFRLASGKFGVFFVSFLEILIHIE